MLRAPSSCSILRSKINGDKYFFSVIDPAANYWLFFQHIPSLHSFTNYLIVFLWFLLYGILLRFGRGVMKCPSNCWLNINVMFQAKEAGTVDGKWLLVNIQDVKEFSCQVLNRDVWSNALVRELIAQHFILWQVRFWDYNKQLAMEDKDNILYMIEWSVELFIRICIRGEWNKMICLSCVTQLSNLRLDVLV